MKTLLFTVYFELFTYFVLIASCVDGRACCPAVTPLIAVGLSGDTNGNRCENLLTQS